MSLRIVPVTLEAANAFVRRLHRHNKPVVGAKFCVGVQAEQLVGVAIVGRPVAPRLDDGFTAEITRVCTDGTRNAASMLYGACRKAARAMGYEAHTHVAGGLNPDKCQECGTDIRNPIHLRMGESKADRINNLFMVPESAAVDGGGQK